MTNITNAIKLYSGERVVQIQLSHAGDDRPYIAALTSIGRILVSSGVWSANKDSWEEIQLPETASSDLDTIE